ncbi:allatostatin-A receptor-like isoform X2 [Acanthaster planci]|uniref:Allatostatin-A receptor-like isoform X2 n=1 Tax=Acanthaster planci TaxID=133434 RepID=A0A8B7YYC8_ACAPL|nr:allatostatin-A receptor-like isoform X2 [Acanthaster planci]
MENSTWTSEMHSGYTTLASSSTSSNQTFTGYSFLDDNGTAGPTEEEPMCFQSELPSAMVVVITVAYAVISFFGVTGNALVAIVIWNNVDMRSSTNYFLVNLSLADLMVMLVCMPPSLLELYFPGWVLGEFMCYLVTTMDSATAHASILTLLAIAVERYYVICMPFKANYTCTSRRTLAICCVAWLVAFLSSIPSVLMTRYVPCQNPTTGDQAGECTGYAKTRLEEAFIAIIFCLFFVIPCWFMTAIYCIIAKTLRMHDNYMAAIRKKESLQAPASSSDLGSRDGRVVELASMPRRDSVEYLMEGNHVAGSPDSRVRCSQSEEPLTVATVQREANHNTSLRPASSGRQHQASSNSSCQSMANAATRQAHRRVVFMLASVVAVFFVCWFPMRIVMMWQVFAPMESVKAWLVNNHHTFTVMLAGFRILIYINSAINPILYNLISTKFRAAFRSVICCEDARRSRSKRSISTRSFTSTSSLRIHSRTTDYHG